MAYTKNKEIVSRIVHKHDTEANWQKATSFIPMLGEIIVYDIDASHGHERFKIGDGKTTVNNLPFQVDITDFENYKAKQEIVVNPTANGNTTAFIDTISQDAQGKITVTKKNVQFPDYSNTYQQKGNYKIIQTAVSDPTASGSASAFIDSISQDTNGKITVTKKNLSLPNILKFIGTTTTTLTDGETTNPITINNQSITAVSGNVVILSGTDQEFLWTGSAWEEFGNASGHSIKGHTHTVTHQPAGSISEVSITPAGSVSQPTFTGTAASHGHTFTGTEATISVTHTPAGNVTISTAAPTSGQTATYTPAGTISKPTFTGTQASIDSSFTPAGTVSTPTFTGSAVTSGQSKTLVESITTSITNRCFTFTINTGTHTHSVTASGSVSQPTFTGSAGTATATYTPAGSISQPTFTGTGRMITGSFSGTSATVSTKYTPAGTISDTSITPAGSVSKPTFTGTESKHTHTFTGTSATLTTSGSNS